MILNKDLYLAQFPLKNSLKPKFLSPKDYMFMDFFWGGGNDKFIQKTKQNKDMFSEFVIKGDKLVIKISNFNKFSLKFVILQKKVTRTLFYV